MNAVICDDCGCVLRESDAHRFNRIEIEVPERAFVKTVYGGHLCPSCIRDHETRRDKQHGGECARKMEAAR